MANWCSTHYVITGDKNELEDFHRVLTELEDNPSRVDNAFGSLWLGNLLDYYGFDWNEIPCRGSIRYFSDEIQDDHIELFAETAWNPMHEVFTSIFIVHYESLFFYYYAEEPGLEIYDTNDTEGIYFSDRYVVSLYVEDENGNEYFTDYYPDLESAIKGTNEQLSLDAPDLPALEQALEERGVIFNINEISVYDGSEDD
ncbi:MAG: hypothetical protein ACOX2M_03420 [Fastidiosipilaceae bacterium]|jgi:hypothetical protein